MKAAQQVKPENIPEELKALNQWVLWKYETRDGKKTKVPYRATGQRAESNNPSTWMTYPDAIANLVHFDGIGIMFGNGLSGIDLDHHLADGGKPDDFAGPIVKELNSYTEITPSGCGLHVLLWGFLPPTGRHSQAKGVEMYDAGRFFTVTGWHLEGTPKTVERRQAEIFRVHRGIFGDPEPQTAPREPKPNKLEDQDLVELATAAKNGAKFLSLWNGSIQDHPSHSEADLALCSLLAFWTGGDLARMDRLFRQSGLMRSQWDKRHRSDGASYGEMTMQKALENTTEFYHPPAPAAAEPPEPYTPPPPEEDGFLIPPDIPTAEIVNQMPGTAASGRFQTFDALDALEFDEPENQLVDGLLQIPSVNALAGAAGIGKSLTILDLSVCVALGTTWLDYKTQQVKCLVIDEESGTKRLKRRLGRVIRGHFAENALKPGDFTCMSLPLLNLKDPREAILLQAKIEELGAKLIVIDALIDVAGGAEENKAEEMHSIFQRLRKIAEECECCFIVLHHVSKLGDVRGSTAIKGACDLILLAEKKADSNRITFEVTKARDIEATQFAATLNFSPDQTWLTAAEVNKSKELLNKSQRYVIDYLTEHGATGLPEIIGAADTCSPSAARQAVYALADKGLIYRTNPDQTGRGSVAIYDLTPDKESLESNGI